MLQHALITGGSGYLGRNLIRFLHRRNIQTTAICRSKKAVKTVESLGSHAHLSSLEDIPELILAAKGCDIAFHSAATTKMYGSLEESRDINVKGSYNVALSCKRAGVRCFVHISSEAVLADGKPIQKADESLPYPPNFAGIYSQTKAEAEQAVLELADENFRVVIIRPRLIWGYDDTSALPQFIEASNKGLLNWFDKGAYKTSTCHVYNVCHGAFQAALQGKNKGIYFLTDGTDLNFRDFISGMLQDNNAKVPTRNAPRWAAQALAYASEGLYKTLGVKPILNKQTLALMINEVTLSDELARREIAYQPREDFIQNLGKGKDFLWNHTQGKTLQETTKN